MADESKQEIVSVASVMAGKLVGASIDTARQNSLIEETLKEMGEDTWQNLFPKSMEKPSSKWQSTMEMRSN